MKLTPFVWLAMVWLLSAGLCLAEENAEKAELKNEIQQMRQALEDMRQAYETRIQQLERKLEALEKTAARPAEAADEAEALRREAETAVAAALPSGPDTQGKPSSPASSLNAFNPRLTVFGDFLARKDDQPVFNEDGNEIGDRIGLREIELDMRADVDPYAKGVLILAFEEENPNEFDPSVEEGYVTFETLPFNLRAKAGRFLTSFGQINRLHRHDLPQVDYPLPVREFLGEEGDSQDGIEISYLAPRLRNNVLELDFQFLNGENEQILAGSASNFPAYLGHLRLFREVGPTQFVEVGASHLFGYNDENNDQASQLSGLDFLYKWKPRERSEYRSFVLQGELFYLDMEQPGADVHSFGAYAYAQVQLGKRWYLGARGDLTEFPEAGDRDAWSVSGYVSYYTTEFLRFRLGWERLEEDQQNPLDTLFLQLTFVFGSHPVEPYWVNR